MFVVADLLTAFDFFCTRGSGKPEKFVIDEHSWLLLYINVTEVEFNGRRHVVLVFAPTVVQLEQV